MFIPPLLIFNRKHREIGDEMVLRCILSENTERTRCYSMLPAFDVSVLFGLLLTYLPYLRPPEKALYRSPYVDTLEAHISVLKSKVSSFPRRSSEQRTIFQAERESLPTICDILWNMPPKMVSNLALSALALCSKLNKCVYQIMCSHLS